MSNEVTVCVNDLPMVTGAGWYHVDALWKHIDRHVPINVMIFVLEGTFSVREEGIDYIVPKNHMIVLKANRQQTAYRYIEPGSHWLWLNFRDIEEGDANKETMTLPKVIGFGNPHTIHFYMKHIYDVEVSNEPYKQQQLNGSLYRLFMEIMVQSQMMGSKKTKRSVALKVIECLQGQVYEVFDSEALSEVLDMNYSYISRKFREETGETVKRFHMTLKVNEAIQLFQSTTMNISEISDKLNFPNPYHFSRVFKQIKGISPSAYREQLY